MERQEHGAAIPCWERAIELSTKERPGPYISLGWSLQEEGRLSEAVEHYRTAVRLQPEAVMAHINLGGIHEELGETAAAEAAYRTAVRIQPNFGLAYARLGTSVARQLPDADLRPSRSDWPIRRRTRRLVARLLFALCLVLDAAWRIRTRRRVLTARPMRSTWSWRGRPAVTRQTLHVQYVESVMRGFTPELFEQFAGAGSEDLRPVFVFGLPRSGTTLVEQVLASHSRVFGAGELKLTRQSFDAIPAVLESPGPALESISR